MLQAFQLFACSFNNNYISKHANQFLMNTTAKNALKQLTLAEHSRVQAEAVAKWLQQSPQHFSLGIDLFQSEEPPIPQRLAWALGIVAEMNPGIIEPHLIELIDFLPETSHQAERRSIVRILAMKQIQIPFDRLGELAELVVLWVPSPNFSIAVRAFSMEIMVKIAKVFPELAREFSLTLEELELEHEGPGVRSKARKARKVLAKISEKHV